ncbi:MAG: MBL fold metallo-hydrolase [Bacteroidetes bacterium]|nr:MBL fold metallo-hydrolase [Bacteroidota bacterium]
MISSKTFTFNAFGENTYVISSGKEALIVDPGCYEADEIEILNTYIANQGLIPRLLINTHCHVDHVLGNYAVKEKYKIPLLIHADEEKVLRSVKVYAPSYGFVQYQETEPDGWITEGQEIKFGDDGCTVLFLPGHAPGHIALYFETQKKLFAGDVLFRESIGRTDLPGGNHEVLLKSIREKIFNLPDDVEVFPGHGLPTTVGHEKIHNPFCGSNSVVAWS